MAALDDGLRKTHLLVELKRTRLHREGARCGSGLRRFVDQANLDAHMRQPQREHQPRGACSRNQNLIVPHDEKDCASTAWMRCVRAGRAPIENALAASGTSSAHGAAPGIAHVYHTCKGGRRPG